MPIASGRRRHSPHSISEPERYVLQNDQDILRAKAFLDLIRPVRIAWLEAAVLLHHYTFGWRLPEVTRIVRRPLREVLAARDSLVRKVAAALGYIQGEVERVELSMTPEERREKVAELYRAGLPWTEIARQVGVSVSRAMAIARELEAEGIALPRRRPELAAHRGASQAA